LLIGTLRGKIAVAPWVFIQVPEQVPTTVVIIGWLGYQSLLDSRIVINGRDDWASFAPLSGATSP